MKAVRNLIIAAIIAVPLAAQAPASAVETWAVDKVHSSATFKIRHIMANVTGQFRDFAGTIQVDRANPANSSVEFTIQTASIDTGNEGRDKHLRSADFFDAEKYPTITFKSTSVKPKSATEFDVTGDFTMHGVTKRITLPVTHLGFGTKKGGFEIETTLNRKDFGIEWNRALDEGGVVLGDDVKVVINLEVNRK